MNGTKEVWVILENQGRKKKKKKKKLLKYVDFATAKQHQWFNIAFCNQNGRPLLAVRENARTTASHMRKKKRRANLFSIYGI